MSNFRLFHFNMKSLTCGLPSSLSNDIFHILPCQLSKYWLNTTSDRVDLSVQALAVLTLSVQSPQTEHKSVTRQPPIITQLIVSNNFTGFPDINTFQDGPPDSRGKTGLWGGNNSFPDWNWYMLHWREWKSDTVNMGLRKHGWEIISQREDIIDTFLNGSNAKLFSKY